MNLSALLARVELFSATANTHDSRQIPDQTARVCQNSQRETSPSYTPWLPRSPAPTHKWSFRLSFLVIIQKLGLQTSEKQVPRIKSFYCVNLIFITNTTEDTCEQ